MSSDFFTTRSLAARGTVQVSRDDTPVAIRLRYVGTGTVTSITTTTATNIVMITSDGGTDTYTFSTHTTIARLIAAINADGIFQAFVLDALLSDSTTISGFVTGTITANEDDNGVVGYDVLVDTSSTDYMTSTLSLKRNWDSITKGHRVHLQEIVYNVDISAAEANAVRIFQRTAGGTEKQIWGIRSVDATATTITFAAGRGKITGADGADLIVRIFDTTSITDNSSNFVQATGIFE